LGYRVRVGESCRRNGLTLLPLFLFSAPSVNDFGIMKAVSGDAKGKGGEMRRVTTEEDIVKDKPVVTDVKPICALCGAELEIDEESGEYRCPICDTEEGQ